MINDERHEKILEIIKEEDYVTVAYLSRKLFASESTIRRDLKLLSRDGLIKRTHGGASAIKNFSIERSLNVRSNTNISKKRRISIAALNLVKNGDFIFMDSSSTCLIFAQSIKNEINLKILTNGVLIAHILSEETDMDVYCACGKVYSKRSSTNGAETCEYISRHYANYSFVSGRGLDLVTGLTDNTQEEAMVKSCFKKNSDKTVALVDSDKLGKRFSHKSLDLLDIDILITDNGIQDRMKTDIENLGIQLIIAK